MMNTKAVLLVSVGLATGFSADDIGGDQLAREVLGAIRPVMEPFHLTGCQPDSERTTERVEATRCKATSEKFKDCPPVAVKWRYSPDGDRHWVPVDAGFYDPPKIRGPGFQEWEGVWVMLSVDDLLNNSRATVVHQCPMMGGLLQSLVETTLYDPEYQREMDAKTAQDGQ